MRHICILSALLSLTVPASAQWINCSETDIPGEVAGGAVVVVPVGSSTPGVSYSVNPSGTDAPTHEFAITRMDVMASDMLGMELLGADEDGIFNPEDFGISEGETFCVTPVSYSIEQLRTLLDSIFLNDVVCCQVLNLASEGFCDTLSNLGYTTGSTVQDLNDVYRVMRLFDEDSTMSLEGFVFQISTVNNAGDILPEECGAQAFPFCYAVKVPFTQQCYSYGEVSSVREMGIFSEMRAFAAEGVLTLDVNAAVQGKGLVTVTAIDGRLVHSSEMIFGQGVNRFELPLKRHGVLNISVTMGHDRRTIRTVSF